MVTKITQNMLNYKGNLDVVAMQKSLNEVRKDLYLRKTEHKQKKSFAPSNLGFVGQCPRHWYYAFTGATYEEKFDQRSLAALENGKAAHVRIQNEYQIAFNAQLEVEIRKAHPPVFGYADVLAKIFGVWAIGDIKTIKDEKFRKLEATMKPDAGNWLQVLIYMYIKNINEGFLHYESKSSHEELFFPFSMTPRAKAYVERVFSWMEMVHDNAQRGELPKRPYEKTDYHCKYCPLAKVCWKDEDGHIELETLVLEKP